ncbi:hypothetical protein [Micromonospora sp. CB01531]|uniref:hypothetical protein n=1 Tax=Micromonospora sp. CB01531 TaxID=1718947 RepID=UPI00093ABE7C|nr:hypothetical protein [Micromonospora sp. CB01531]OKI48971.1 hypothetical protein A6A27_36195 [Micromonospora sp. CB01531]
MAGTHPDGPHHELATSAPGTGNLLDWVRDILTTTYGLVGHTGGRQRKLPPRWYRHPDAVTELSWLCQESHRIYRPAKGTPAAAGEWHNRGCRAQSTGCSPSPPIAKISFL